MLNRTGGERPGPVSPEARVLHASSFVVDLHADSLVFGRDLLEEGSLGHVDIPRMRKGGMALQVFTIFTKAPLGMNFRYTSAHWPDMLTALGWMQDWPREVLRSLVEYFKCL